MLSNKHKYTLLRVSRLLLAPLYSLLALFVKKNENIIITASLNMEFSDNAKALFDMLNHREEFKDRVYFVINDEQKRQELNRKYPGKFISNLSFEEALFILKAQYWFCSAMELPLATFYQRNLRQVIHLGHGMLYKRIGLIERKSSWYKKLYYVLVNSSFTYTIATTEFCRKDISAGFGIPFSRVILTPQPKTSQVAFPKPVSNTALSNSNFTHILYAPTWRPYASVELFNFEDMDFDGFSSFLSINNIHIWLRVHPRIEQDINPSLLACENIHMFSGSEYSNVNSYLNYFDALITDYSSIYYDYLTLERPVLFFDYDFEKYDEIVGVIDDFKIVKSTDTTKSMKQFMAQLLVINKNEWSLERIKEINKIINYPIGNDKIKDIVLNKFGLD